MEAINLTNPLIILSILTLLILSIVIGKKTKMSMIPLTGVIVTILVLLYNSIIVFALQKDSEVIRTIILKSGIFNLGLIFLSFIGYLWVDDVEAKFKNKKSIDNSMDWFWNSI